MKAGMSLSELLAEVQRQAAVKRDFVAPTESLSMVDMPTFPKKVALVMLQKNADSQLQRFEITETFHKQLAQRLQIPWQYYDRLLEDHRDLVMHQTNELLRREPAVRLVRTLDGKARAFLSDRFRPLDNVQVLQEVLPPLVKEEIPSKLLNSDINENSMSLRVMFTDPALQQDIGDAPRGGGRDIVRPGCIVSNSEVGKGSMVIDGFFYRDYCLNGCVFGKREMFSYRRNHLGGKLEEGELQFSDDTRAKQSAVIVAEMRDVLRMLSSREFAQKMGDKARAARSGEAIRQPYQAIEKLAEEVTLRESEKELVLTNLLSDGDLSRWGMLNAVTAVANRDDVSMQRAGELEEIGAQLLDMDLKRWDTIALARAA